MVSINKQLKLQLDSFQSDCSQCSGLCCTALFFSKIDGFPENKRAGVPCKNLQSDFRCCIHEHLSQDHMKGCIGYDCFGAGQQVTQNIYHSKTWKDSKEQANDIFEVFHIVTQMHQIRYYLTQAATMNAAKELKEQLSDCIQEKLSVCNRTPKEILLFDVEGHRDRANVLLKKACQQVLQSLHSQTKKCPENFMGKKFINQDLSGLDLSVQLLIAADFTGCVFDQTVFLGADTRDAKFHDADLSKSLFLSQGQVNAAKGNKNTKLPGHLMVPVTWKEKKGKD